ALRDPRSMPSIRRRQSCFPPGPDTTRPGGGGVYPVSRAGPRSVSGCSAAHYDAGGDGEADEPRHFLLLDRTGESDLGLELGELLDRDTNLVHFALPSLFGFDRGGFCQKYVETLLSDSTDSVYSK